MVIAIVGASGFVGKNLITYLLENTDYSINAVSRNLIEVKIPKKFKNRIKLFNTDVCNIKEATKALKDADVAYFLTHSMSDKVADLYKKENDVARCFIKTAKKCRIKKIIYLGALGEENDNLSKHLKSRQNVGKIFQKYHPLVIEFRASIVIGNGSVSYEIIKTLVNKLPIMVLPSWANTLAQPICIDDLLLYLYGALRLEESEIIEIGGPEVMQYKELLNRYAKFMGKKLIIIEIKLLPNILANFWLKIFIDKKHYQIAKCMTDSLNNEVILNNDNAKLIFYDIEPQKIEKCL